MSETNLQSTDTVKSTFWHYAMPSVIAMMVTGLYQVIDGIFVGHYVGVKGLAAINIAFPVLGSLMGLGLMIGMGSGSLLSIFRGEKKEANAQKVIANSLWLILIFALISATTLLFISDSLLSLQGAKDIVYDYAMSYITIFIYGAILTIGATALPMLVRNNNSPYIATALMIIGALLNIILDYVLLDLYSLGLPGAAIATIISQSIVMLLALAYFFTSNAHIQLNWCALMPDVNIAKHCVTLGLSGFFIYLYFGFIMAVHNKLFMEYGGAVHVAAFAIVGYLATLYYLFAEGVANGLQPPVSYYFGSNDHKKIQQTVNYAVKIVVYTGIAMYLLLVLNDSFVIGLFTRDDNALIEATAMGIRLHLFADALDGFIFIASVYFMSVNQSGKAIAIAVANILVQLPFLFFLPQWLGVNGIWLLVPISNICLTLLIAPLLYREVNRLTKTPTLITTRSIASYC
ncbi:MATE family efflux transporter [Colwellia ponticola]|uniref:Multidrug export protein MepA n=1 Tax=Colwellia ponticola TaxID=2304625 RepID=A0A8H2JM53_9GAMM|nr:MATE family efflux transporter [Colwellia ponticola]TMM45977.1 MATE family efflux transporter [Colwellia ponticola]